MRLIERIEQLAKASGGEPRCIEVPELADADGKCLVYVWPVNLKEMDAIASAHAKGIASTYAATLLVRAKDKDKLALFTEADLGQLMSVRGSGFELVRRLANKINEDVGGDAPTSGELTELGED